MPSKKIYCTGCNTYLGIIREATLRKDVHCLCKKCEVKRLALEMQRNSRPSVDMGEIFGGIFKK